MPASEHMRDLTKFPISIREGNLNARKGWRRDSEKNIWGEKIAARKLEGDTFTFSLDGLSNHDFAALRFIFHSVRAVQISRALRKSDSNLCVHISNGNRTEWIPIRSVIIQAITKLNDHAAEVRFVYHEHDKELSDKKRLVTNSFASLRPKFLSATNN